MFTSSQYSNENTEVYAAAARHDLAGQAQKFQHNHQKLYHMLKALAKSMDIRSVWISVSQFKERSWINEISYISQELLCLNPCRFRISRWFIMFDEMMSSNNFLGYTT